MTDTEQRAIVKILLELSDYESQDASNLESILEVAEIAKKYTSENNALIFDFTEYLYEKTRALRDEEHAHADPQIRKGIEQAISDLKLR